MSWRNDIGRTDIVKARTEEDALIEGEVERVKVQTDGPDVLEVEVFEVHQQPPESRKTISYLDTVAVIRDDLLSQVD